MRLFAFWLGPWYRRMKASKRFRGLYYVCLGLFCVGAGTAAGVVRSVQEASGWTKVYATVIRAGTFPVDASDPDNSSDTVSVLRFTLPGHARPVQRSASMPWWYREHTSHSQLFVWVKGSVISSADQTGLHWVIVGGIAAGLIFWVITFYLGTWLKDSIGYYEIRPEVMARRRRRVARQDRHKSAVSSLADLIALCRKHRRTRITLKQAVAITHCRSGVTSFRNAHFPRRNRIKLEELIPHLEGTTGLEQYEWRNVIRVAVQRLIDIGAAKSTAAYQDIPFPTHSS